MPHNLCTSPNIVRVCLSTTRNKLEIVLQMWELIVRGLQFEDLTRERHMPKPLPLPSQYIL